MYIDQTGMFPVQSYNNMKLIFVEHVYDINEILAIPLKSRTSQSMVGAFEQVIKYLDKRDYKSIVNVMDNEGSKVVEQYINNDNFDIELFPARITI